MSVFIIIIFWSQVCTEVKSVLTVLAFQQHLLHCLSLLTKCVNKTFLIKEYFFKKTIKHGDGVGPKNPKKGINMVVSKPEIALKTAFKCKKKALNCNQVLFLHFIFIILFLWLIGFLWQTVFIKRSMKLSFLKLAGFSYLNWRP